MTESGDGTKRGEQPDQAAPEQRAEDEPQDDQHLTRRGEAADDVPTLPKEQTPNATSPVPDEYRRDPSDDGLPE
jgi:hypothetical protein